MRVRDIVVVVRPDAMSRDRGVVKGDIGIVTTEATSMSYYVALLRLGEEVYFNDSEIRLFLEEDLK